MMVLWYFIRILLATISIAGMFISASFIWFPGNPASSMHTVGSIGALIGSIGWMIAFFPGWIFTGDQIQREKNRSLARRKALSGSCYYSTPCPHQSYANCKKHWDKGLGVDR